MRNWRLFLILAATMAGRAGAVEQPIRLVSDENAPFAYTSSAGLVVGISTEMALEATRRAGVPASIDLYPWARAYFRAQTVADTCVYPVARLPEREAQFQWVGPLNKNRWVLFARPDFAPAIADLADVRHYRVGGLLKDGPSLFLQGQGVEVAQVGTNELNLNKLMAGRIDLWATGYVRGKLIAAKARVGELKMAYVIKDVDHYLACNPKLPAAAIAALDAAILTMWQDGTARRISERYQSNPPE
jgi:polar amino acid transport system substrate-binding protein